MDLDHVHPGGAGAHVLHRTLEEHGRFRGHETQRDKLGEATGALLNIPQQGDVSHDLGVGLTVPEHDRGGGRDAQVVGGGYHLNPLVNGDAARGDDVPQPLVQHFGGGSRQAAHASVLQSLQILADAAPGADGAVQHLLRRKPVDVHIGQLFLDRRAQPDVQVALHLGRKAGLDADLGCAVVLGLPGAADDLAHRQEVPFLLAEVPAEGAEPAPLDADVGEVDVPVHHVSDHIADDAAAQLVGHHGHRRELGAAGGEQQIGFLDGDVLAGQGAVQRGCDIGVNPFHQRGKGCRNVFISHCGHSVGFPLSRIHSGR